MTSRLLYPLEVAERLGVTVGALATMRYEKRGPAYVKLSEKHVRYPEDELNEWLESRTQRPEARVAA